MNHRFLALILVLLLSILAGCSASQRAIDEDQVGPNDKLILRFPFVTGEDTPKGIAALKFKQLVELRSNGKVEVQLFPNATLYSDEEEISELQKGSIQIIAPAVSKLTNDVPELQMFDLPYFFSTPQDVWNLWEGPVGTEFTRLIEAQGYKVLGLWDNGFKQITSSEHPIKNPQDMANMTFRIMSSGLLQQQFATVKAKTVAMPFEEVNSALEKGQVDGEENTISNIYNKKLYASQKYLTKSDHGYLGYLVLSKKSFWDSIPEETRTMLEKTLDEVSKSERESALVINKQQYTELKKKPGIQIYELNEKEKQEWKKALSETYDWYGMQIGSDVIRQYFLKHKW